MRLARGLAGVGGALFVLAVAPPCLSPAGVQAQGQPFGQASVVGDVLLLEATAGVENRIQVNPKGSDWIVTDERGPWVAGPGCAQLGDAVTCPQASVASLEAETGDLEDHIRATVDIPATIATGTGGDQARGGSESDLLLGGPGNDNLEGRGAPDIIDGGDGRDTVLYVLRTAAQPVEVTLDGAANDGGAEDGFADHILANVENVNATPGDDTLLGNAEVNGMIGGDGADVIAGGGGADSLFGQGGTDTLLGEAGNDALDGGDGADAINGGTETDSAQYRSRTAAQPVRVSIDGIANDGGTVDGRADNVLPDVENVAGGAGPDSLTGSEGANSLTGNGGGDTLDGGAGPDSLEGGTERDIARYATRGAAEPVVVSLDGAANDGGAIDGGAHDNIRPTIESVIGGAGNDELTGSDAANTLTGGAGADTLTGGGGADSLVGGDGVDALAGGADRDSLDGGPGPDSLDGGTGRDVTRYSSRTVGQPVSVTLDGVADDGGALDGFADDLREVESVVGGAGDDSLTGNAVTNVLTGNGGEDELHGLAGNDELRASGDGFDDTITCGAGPADHVFADATDSFPVAGPDACELVD